MIKTQNTQYKKTLRNELAKIGVELDGGYYNDKQGTMANKSTSRRIKAGVSRPLTLSELLTVAEGLSEQFGVFVSTKNYVYRNSNTIVVYVRRWQ